SVQNLKTYFPQDEGIVKAVDGASFALRAGRTLGIVGESGCGKSMTARSILRIVDRPGRIVEGQIFFQRQASASATDTEAVIDLVQLEAYGEEMRAIRGAEIALIFQEPMSSFSPVHTVGNQIMEAILLHQQVGKREARARALDMFRRVGIPLPEQRLDAYAYQLSGGLRQRAMIAMALSCNPRLLIADEPTTALDVTTQAQILDLMRQLQREYSMAIMLITHDLGVVAEMADEVVVMYLGRVVEQASVDEIFYAPKHPYTQALLRSIPHIRSKAREPLASIAGFVPHPYNRPPGCPFHPRCASFMPGVCDRREPELLQLDGQHAVSCFLYTGA
ncbi:MAG: ABC transporter ATP-binding protein, partial [Candidatus Tectomicrobia bacterium]|nr:ABC transporter ATP-binding protein [Candidatus Tectomicrobia bacterium]